MRRVFTAGAAGLCLLLAAGCSGTPWGAVKNWLGTNNRRITVAEASQDPYRLKVGDTLAISVWGHEDLEREVPIRTDGVFIFPLVGRLEAAGLTLQEVEDTLAARLDRDYIVKPQVTIQLAGAQFTVLGEVQRPGSFEITGAMDLLTALSLAGGINKFGSGSIEIIRQKGDGNVTIRVDLNAILSGSQPNVYIFPNDTLYVRRRIF